MYNKLFSKILDSSVWLEPSNTRIVWLTLIAAMDQDGFAQFASAANLANRAVVPLADVEIAIKTLESPDPNSSDTDNEGRRIERVPGGWLVLNAPKYKDIVTSAVAREKTRQRVARWRDAKRNASVTLRNAGNKNVTPSETETDTATETELGVVGETSAKARSAKPSKRRFASRSIDDEYLDELQAKTCYEHIAVKAELQRALAWADANHRQVTARFFVNWLNRIEVPAKSKGDDGGEIIRSVRRKETNSERKWRETAEYCAKLDAGELDPAMLLISGNAADRTK